MIEKGGVKNVQKILLPTDGSKYAERAGEQAIWIANAGLSDLVVLSVVDAGYLDALTEQDLQDKLETSLKRDGRN